jgi:hypothetical protein
MNSYESVLSNDDHTGGYENINLEEASGVDFLRENSQLILADCLDLLEELGETGLDSRLENKRTKVQALFATLQVLLDDLSRESVDDAVVDEIEKTYNNLMAEQEMIAQIYLESADLSEENIDQATKDEALDSQNSSLERNRVSKKLSIFGEEDLTNIKIDVMIDEPEVIQSETSPTPVVKKPDTLPVAIISSLEKSDPINQGVYSPSLAGRNKARAEMAEAVWSKYISKEDLASILGKDFPVKAFTRNFEAVTSRIEQDSVDVFERWLGESKADVFDFIKDMTLSELDNLTADPNLKLILKNNNIKYETFIRWIDEYKMIDEYIGPNRNALFGELMGLYVALKIAEKKTKSE